ncbi:hypothetical protein LUZ63_019262 [Rhynchospora breviuscula]|uniref:Uncharacterized protein n=1 Tax=Rhynchospora breviuscula TaxID=2022672 RepID=A0A9Q0C5V0_9POAL|nr:hypothetical protein LUZ63_019262 [Rhynchospora breviuscula]
MPGSIHLSVVEWIEAPPQGTFSTPHSIKVLVGKNAYQSVGREDFTFPVTSIRDNIVIMLCDSEGNLVTKKEVKTISVAEKGDAEIVFTLEFGGDFKLRLSFVLNEEEKEKIRELRSSVLKRKHAELLKGTSDIFSPGTSSQLKSKDHSELSTIKIPKMSTVLNPNKTEKNELQISFLRVSQSVDDLTGANIKRSIPNKSPSDNIRKMISAFEGNSKQNSVSQISPRTRTRLNKINSQTSMESMLYENEDIKQRRGSQTLIRRSFSAGDLADAILQNDPNGPLISTSNERVEVGHHIQHKNGGLSSKLLSRTSHYQDWDFSEHMDDLSFIDKTSYFLGITDMLMPYHLCLTSAPEEVRKCLQNFTASSMHYKKIKLHGVASHGDKKEIGSRSQTEDLHRKKVGSSNLNGWLIEQGARIFIVVVACGTIILNSR